MFETGRSGCELLCREDEINPSLARLETKFTDAKNDSALPRISLNSSLSRKL